MRLTLRDNLPFTSVALTLGGITIQADNVLVDTGSARTTVASRIVAKLGIFASPQDRFRKLRGVGGQEVVFFRELDRVAVEGHGIDGFLLGVSAMEYGFEIGGILGMDFLYSAGAIVNLLDLTLGFAQ